MSALQTESVGGLSQDYKFRQISLIPQNRKLLHRRIEQRFQTMMDLGFAQEVMDLYNRGDLHRNLSAIRSVGYRQLWDYCAGKCSLDDAVEKGVIATRQLAKRQMTWLRYWPDAIEISIDNEKDYLSTKEICKQTLKVL
jgi:tRNA dimethylallyltransferase